MRRKDYYKNIFNHDFITFLNCSFSQEGEDVIINDLLDRKANGRYVDIGGFHPMRYSNTYSFYLKGWRGLNIDATPGKMKEFNKIRPDDINLEAAISHEGGMKTLYRFSDGALDTFDESRINHLIECGYELIEKVEVQTFNIMDILDKYVKGKDIDLIDIDVEGVDEIVVSDIDWHAYHPTVVLAEIGLQGNNNDIINKILVDNGYNLVANTSRTGIYK